MKDLKRKFIYAFLGAFSLIVGCEEKKIKNDPVTSVTKIKVLAPDFNSDSAFKYVLEQVKFGPRVPNSVAHVECGDYLITLLKTYTPEVKVQEFEARAFDGKMLRLRNIIASINPQAQKRIILASHWDSRPFAEKDSVDKNTPIDGANDGASGVGVIAEIARAIKSYKDKPEVGLDLILFDGEDYGHSEGMPGVHGNDTWCLGSQYWSKNKHKVNYAAYYGILLDMVGAGKARFLMEGTSMEYAPDIVRKVWQTAAAEGYSANFVPDNTDGIVDDHTYVNSIAKIPMIDIIEYDANTNTHFGWYHHTHKDNISIIDKGTLKAVGQTLLEVVYAE